MRPSRGLQIDPGHTAKPSPWSSKDNLLSVAPDEHAPDVTAWSWLKTSPLSVVKPILVMHVAPVSLVNIPYPVVGLKKAAFTSWLVETGVVVVVVVVSEVPALPGIVEGVRGAWEHPPKSPRSLTRPALTTMCRDGRCVEVMR